MPHWVLIFMCSSILLHPFYSHSLSHHSGAGQLLVCFPAPAFRYHHIAAYPCRPSCPGEAATTWAGSWSHTKIWQVHNKLTWLLPAADPWGGRGWDSPSNKNSRRAAGLLLGLFQRKLKGKEKQPLLIELCNFFISDWWAEGAIGCTFHLGKGLPTNRFSSRWTCGSVSLTCSHPCRQSRSVISQWLCWPVLTDVLIPKDFQIFLAFSFRPVFSPPVSFQGPSILLKVHFLPLVIPTFSLHHLVTIF